MTWQSTAPDALSALVTVFTGSTNAEVFDGPVVSSKAVNEAVIVGWNGRDDAAAIETDLEAGGLRGSPDRESHVIHCAVSVLNRSADITAARSRAYEILAQLGNGLTADMTLGGAVMTAQMTAANLSQSQTQQGALAEITFDVTCDAFTSH